MPLIPPPYANLVRTFGLFAPNAKLRDRLPAAPAGALDVQPEVQARLDAAELSPLAPAKRGERASRSRATGQPAAPSLALTPEAIPLVLFSRPKPLPAEP